MGVEIKQVTVDLGDKCPEHKKLIVFILALVQIILGVLDIAFFIGLLVIGAWPYASGCGIWGGILFVATGVIGILAYRLDKMLWVVLSIGLSTISAVFAFCFFIVHAVGTSKYDFNCSGTVFKVVKGFCGNIESAKALNAILMLVCLALLVVCAVLVVLSVLSIIKHTKNANKSQYTPQETNHQVPKNEMHEVGHDNEAVTVKEDGRNDNEMDNVDVVHVEEKL